MKRWLLPAILGVLTLAPLAEARDRGDRWRGRDRSGYHRYVPRHDGYRYRNFPPGADRRFHRDRYYYDRYDRHGRYGRYNGYNGYDWDRYRGRYRYPPSYYRYYPRSYFYYYTPYYAPPFFILR